MCTMCSYTNITHYMEIFDPAIIYKVVAIQKQTERINKQRTTSTIGKGMQKWYLYIIMDKKSRKQKIGLENIKMKLNYE